MPTPKKHRSTSTDARRAAIYTRISLDHTGEQLGVQRQEADARAICDQRGWEVVGVYSDNSISATDARKHRPGYEALRRDHADGLFDALVCYDLDRLTRQPRQLEDWIDAAEASGLALVTTNGEADLTTDAGRLFARIKAAVARSEVERKGARHRAALEQHARAGKAPHGIPLYGYTTTTGNLVPDEAKVVRRVFTAFDAGESLRSITAGLTRDGVPTRKGGPWNTRTVRDMLTNVRYTGVAVYRGEVLTDDDGNPVRGKWEPLVTSEMFAVVQARLSDPSRKTNRAGTHRRYIGSALYVCDYCGGPIRTTDGRYVCEQPRHVYRVRKHVDEYVVDVIAERLARPDLAELLAPVGEDMAPVVAESERLRKRLAQVDLDYDMDLIDARRWKAKKARVHAELTEVDKKLATRTGGAALGAVVTAPDPAQAFLSASLMGQRAVIDALAVVRLRRGKMGRLKRDSTGRQVIHPDTVVIDWRR